MLKFCVLRSIPTRSPSRMAITRASTDKGRHPADTEDAGSNGHYHGMDVDARLGLFDSSSRNTHVDRRQGDSLPIEIKIGARINQNKLLLTKYIF